ncbi:MAG: single-stranded-DNA-specific exonuclease RecJ [Bacillota bacterium]
MGKRKIWNIYQTQGEIQHKLIKELQISPALAMLLVNRGFCDSKEAMDFLEPKLELLQSPFAIKNLTKAVDKIQSAINQQKKILIYGDYDVDGITSTALLTETLKNLQAQVEYYIPDRIEEGYGLNKEALTGHYQRGVDLVITVDCGISAWEEVIYGQDLGLDFIITDHHQPPEKLPPCLIINPVLEDKEVPWKELAGVGVAFKLAHGLFSRLLGEEKAYEKITTLLDLTCLGTIADIVPLINENRILVKHGLKQISNNGRVGLKTLCETAGLDINNLSATGIGFFLAPRLNACGRIGNASIGVRLLLSSNYLEAREIANFLNKENQNRQNIEGQIFKEAVELVENLQLHKEKVIVLAGEQWHQGVVGIVASRLLEKYARPAIVLTLQNDIYKGSGRSIPGFHLQKALVQCQDLLESFGGHSQAAGLSIGKNNLQDFTKKINLLADEIIIDDDFIQSIDIDGEVNLETADFDLLDEIKKLEPFGCANPEPTLVYRRGEVQEYKEVGTNGGHLKLKIKAGNSYWDGIGFNMASYKEIAASQEPLDLAFNLDKNTWNGKTSLQLILKDMKPFKEIDNPKNPPDFLERLFLFGQDYLKVDVSLLKKREEWDQVPPVSSDVRNTLANLGPKELLAEIKSRLMGNDYLPTQWETLESLLRGENTLAVLERGKSSVLQSFAAYLTLTTLKTTVIICPLRNLVNNLYHFLKGELSSLGLNIAKADGFLDLSERFHLFSELELGKIDIIVTTPQFFCYYKSKFMALAKKIGLMVFDECQYFAYQNQGYEMLSQIINEFSDAQRLALTNNLENKALEMIQRKLGITKVIFDSKTRENLRIIDVRGFNDKIGYIKKILLSNEKTLVYVSCKEIAYSLAAELRKDLPLYKEKIGYIHHGLDSSDRYQLETLFKKGVLQFIVANGSLGECMSSGDIENVILYNICFSKEEYSLLTVMAGRNGKNPRIHLLYGGKDIESNRQYLASVAPGRNQLANFYLFLKKLAANNNPLTMTNEQLYQWAKIYKITDAGEQAIKIWLDIFEELDIIEQNLSGDKREIHVKNNPPKVELESSVIYLEGHEEKTNFEEFIK